MTRGGRGRCILLYYPWLLPLAYARRVDRVDPIPEELSSHLGIPRRLAKSLAFYYKKVGEPDIDCVYRIGRVFAGLCDGFLLYAILRRRSVRSGRIPVVRVLGSGGREDRSIPPLLRRSIGEIKLFIEKCYK